MTEAGGDLCRVTVVAPRMRLDVAVPSEVPVASLLPTLLWHTGEQDEAAPSGWALQRAGEGPLDTGLTMAGLGVRDGDILYLRTRAGAAPALVFDDAADAITSTLKERSARWDRRHSRAALLTAIGVLLATGALGLAISGGVFRAAAASGELAASRELTAALAAAVLAAGALVAAAAMSRAFADAQLGTVFALGALPYAFTAGLLVLPGLGSGSAAGGRPAFLTGCTLVVIAAALGVAAVGHGDSMVTGAVAGGFAGVAGGLLALSTSSAGAAAAVVSLALVATPEIPPAAYRIARLPRPVVPATPEELRQRPEPADLASVPERAVAADRVVGALVSATGAVTVIGVAIMLRHPGWAGPALAALAGALLLLRARLFTGTVARGWLLGSGLAVLVLFAVAEAGRWPVTVTAVVAIAVTVAAGLLARAALGLGDRPPPTLGRMVDLAELAATVATIPLALVVLGVFGAVRALGG
jgi:type VII secretion integral membrane protein EccD